MLPFGKAGDTGQLQLPRGVVVVVQTTVPVGCVVTVTGVLGVPVPLSIGFVVLTGTPGTGLFIAGEVLSTVKARVAGGLALPAASVATTLTEFGPFGSAVLSQVHRPLALTVVVHNSVPPASLTVMVLPGSALPLTVGVLSPVVVPVMGAVTTGWAGATVSIITVTGVPTGLTLPAGSVTVVPSVCGPLDSGVVGAQLQVPFG